MTTPMDDARAAIGRQLSVAYLPTVRWPLPRELEDLVVQLVAFEMRERGSSVDTRGGFAMRYGTAGTGSPLR